LCLYIAGSIPATAQLIINKNRKMFFMKQKRIYITGKITGSLVDEYERNFGIASLDLMFRGYEPTDPVELYFDTNSDDSHSSVERCLLKLASCDGIYLLRNWKESNRARIEKIVADIIKSYNPDFIIIEQ
jgi:hypothetical protein